jgi:DNA (cytosine-5)-methyltransferase 3A
MNVLSLFDGMSCGRIALNRAGVTPSRYLAAEIDKYAIQVSKDNWNDIEHIGDVTIVNSESLPRIDLLIGGSPCQGFSFAGKQLNFEDPRSKLFFEYVRLLRECKPKYFLLENVIMKQEYQDVISEQLGVKPVRIESSDFSAQKRSRLYWTNIPILPWKDKGIVLSDIIEHGLVDRDKSYCIDANYFKGTNLEQYLKKKRRQVVFERSSKPIRLGAVTKSMGTRVYHESGKSVCLSALGGGWGAKTGLYHDDYCIRKLSVLECKRLQTVPDDYIMNVSKAQAYKMLGNGWTVDVIAHIFKGMSEYFDDSVFYEIEARNIREMLYK